MIILSFDCAYRSIGYSLVKYNDIQLKNDQQKILNNKFKFTLIDLYNNYLNGSYIQLIDYGGGDILDGLRICKTSQSVRFKYIINFLDKIDISNYQSITVLVEHQHRKFRSYEVECVISSYYLMKGIDVVVYNTRQKNKINLSTNIIYNEILHNYNGNRYKANKEHSNQNFAILSKAFNLKIQSKLSIRNDIIESILEGFYYWRDLKIYEKKMYNII